MYFLLIIIIKIKIIVIILIVYKRQKGPILDSSDMSKSTTATLPHSTHLTSVAWQHRDADGGSIVILDLTMFFATHVR